LDNKKRKKSMGTKIYVFVAVLAIISFAIVASNTNALKEIGTVNTKETAYLELVEAKGDLLSTIQETNLYANLAYYYMVANNPAAGDVYGAFKTARQTMEELAGGVVEAAEKSSDAEVIAASKNLQDTIKGFGEYLDSVAAAADAGDMETVSALVGSIYPQTSLVSASAEELDTILEDKVAKVERQSATRISGTTAFNNICMVLVIAVTVICIVFLAKTVVKPAKDATKEVQDIVKNLEAGNGDLTTRITIKENDEVGQLVAAVNMFIEVLQGTITSIKQESGNMEYSVEKVNQGIVESNESASNISATMEEMSASIEEVTATISIVASGSDSILADVRSMSDQIQNGVHLVRDINDRAGEMRDDTTSEQKKIIETVEKLRDELAKAVEESKKAEKINDLTNDILSITSQTNLLALNASIEAARAGEAGRGFAVVADEIRVLADSSRDTANNIQEISSTVIKAVHKLTSDAQSMLKFIDEDVMKDFDNFVTIVEQYKSDADSMDEIIKSFDENVSTISDTVTAMNESMNDISTAMDENAKGVTNVAESAVDLVNVMADIQTQAEDNDRIAKRLGEEVSKFKKI